YAGTGLPGQLPVVTGHLEVGELGTGSRQGQGEALVFAREVLGGTAYEPARLTLLPFAPPREPVGEHGPNARVVQGLDHGVGMGGRALDVGPVEESGDTGVDCSQCRHEIAEVGVFGPEGRSQLVE